MKMKQTKEEILLKAKARVKRLYYSTPEGKLRKKEIDRKHYLKRKDRPEYKAMMRKASLAYYHRNKNKKDAK